MGEIEVCAEGLQVRPVRGGLSANIVKVFDPVDPDDPVFAGVCLLEGVEDVAGLLSGSRALLCHQWLQDEPICGAQVARVEPFHTDRKVFNIEEPVVNWDPGILQWDANWSWDLNGTRI